MLHTDKHISTTIDPVTIDVRDCLAAVEDLVRRTWPSNIRLELHAASDLPPVRCDQLDLQDAIMNLAFNKRNESQAQPAG